MDIPITLGSDAHYIEDIGYELKGEVKEELKKVGIKHANYFVKRERVEYKIEGLWRREEEE